MKHYNLLIMPAFMAIVMTGPCYADTVNTSGIGNTVSHSDSTVSNTANPTNTNNNNQHLTATGGSAYSVSGSESSASSHNYNTNTAKQAQGQVQSADNAGNAQAVTQNYEAQKRAPASTAFAAPLVAADDTCMGSSSLGGQGVGFGLSVGSTWHDTDCVRRKDARELHNMGQKAAALALMCQNESVAAAMATAGTPCPGLAAKSERVSEAAEPSHHYASVKSDDSVTYEYPTSAKRAQW